MLEKYKVVYKGGQDEIIEKKSRFIATVAPVEIKIYRICNTGGE